MDDTVQRQLVHPKYPVKKENHNNCVYKINYAASH